MRNPLELMMDVMERRWIAGDEKGAVEMAKLIAPYLHPRATGKGVVDFAGVDDAELGGCIEGTGAAAEDSDEPG